MKIQKTGVDFVRLTLVDGDGPILIECAWDELRKQWQVGGLYSALHREQKQFVVEWLQKQFGK